MHLARRLDGPTISPISPLVEMGAYEALWLEPNASFKSIAEKFEADPTALPSDFVSPAIAQECAAKTLSIFEQAGIKRFGVRVNHAGDYPPKLRDARYPVELLYFQGAWELTETRCVAVVGTRKPTNEGIRRAGKIARDLVGKNFTVVSGLAEGIDTAAHQAAIDSGGRTIAVIGTPLGIHYPKQNQALQDFIAENFLIISQVPVLRYANQAIPHNRLFFPERNVTMSALTDATIIVEAGETSGTLIQARAAIYQKRKLLILDSCFNNPKITWPSRFEELGAIRVRSAEDIWVALGQ